MKVSRENLNLEAQEMIDTICCKLNNLDILELDSMNLSKTILVIVDLNNGFAKRGSLYSPRVEALIKPIEGVTKKALENNLEVIAFTDYHTSESIELNSYPPHCMKDSDEWELVDELKLDGIKVIKKNSTNGFIEKEFSAKDDCENVIVVGDCTDICIYQFTITLKTYYNSINKDVNVYVPMNLVDTYDAPGHRANFLNYVFLNSMIDNGIHVVKKIKY